MRLSGSHFLLMSRECSPLEQRGICQVTMQALCYKGEGLQEGGVFGVQCKQ